MNSFTFQLIVQLRRLYNPYVSISKPTKVTIFIYHGTMSSCPKRDTLAGFVLLNIAAIRGIISKILKADIWRAICMYGMSLVQVQAWFFLTGKACLYRYIVYMSYGVRVCDHFLESENSYENFELRDRKFAYSFRGDMDWSIYDSVTSPMDSSCYVSTKYRFRAILFVATESWLPQLDTGELIFITYISYKGVSQTVFSAQLLDEQALWSWTGPEFCYPFTCRTRF